MQLFLQNKIDLQIIIANECTHNNDNVKVEIPLNVNSLKHNALSGFGTRRSIHSMFGYPPFFRRQMYESGPIVNETRPSAQLYC